MIESGQTINVTFHARNPTTGLLENVADLAVSLRINGVANAAAVTLGNPSTGEFLATVTLPALDPGDVAELVASSTIYSDRQVVWRDSTTTLSGLVEPDDDSPGHRFTAQALELAAGAGDAPPDAVAYPVQIANEMTNEGIQGATVWITFESGVIADGPKITNADGRTTFLLSPGDYLLYAVVPNYASITGREITVTAS